MTTNGLDRLETWVKAREYAVEVYRNILPLLPPEEKFNLKSQIRRAATSIPANIAEGYGRFYYQANIQFCYNARGSLDELLSHLMLSHDLGFMDDEVFSQIKSKGNGLVLLINGYISYLKRVKHGEDEPGSPGRIQEEKGIYEVGG
ncbi:MAG: four helix bundle protein [Anaerolinea sp.]|nr:four helix bundle protein [Anaerolinea sp.]